MNTLRRLLSTTLLLVALAATAVGQTVSRVEYYWDTDPGRGHGTPITGWSAANQVNINTTISTAGLSAGIHTLGLRSRSNYGVWSPVYLQRVVVGQQVSRIEYFYDTDPGYGNGTAYASTEAGGTVVINDAQLSATGISDGFHRLGLRARAGTNGMWSPTYWAPVLVNGAGVVQVEYFFDTVPAYGEGTQYTSFTHGTTVSINNAQLSAAGVSDGFHRLGLRAKSGGLNGLWSPVYWQDVLVNSVGITQVEYFYDSVPAYGEGTQYTAFTQGTTVNINNAQLSAAGISDGFHRLGLRAKSGGSNGLWSPVYWQDVLVNGAGITQVEYFFDDVPAYGEGIQYTAFTQGSTVNINNAQLSATGVSNGYHRLGLRAKSGGPNGLWSPVYWQNVLVNGAGITQVEYYWDDANPALGEATPYTGFTAGTMVNISGAQISTAGLSTGVHRLALRARTGNGLWSPTYFHEVFVGQGADYAEYYWDTDPGYGNGSAIPLTADTVAMVNLSNIAVPTSDGLHVLCIRARAGKMWSPTYTKTYCNAPTPQFSILGGDTVCQGEQIIVLDESEGVTAQSLYYWDMNSDGTDDYTVHGDLTHTYTQAGVYTLTLGLGADESCRNTYSRTVMVRSTQSPSVSISRDKNGVCEGTEVRFVATTQRAADYSPQLEWYRNDTLMAGLTADTIYLDDLRNGDRIRALVRVDNPCATADSAWSSQLSMTIYSLPEVTLHHRRFVFSDETAFTLASRFQGTPAGGTYRLNGVESSLFNPSRNANELYEISYTYTNNHGCSSTVIDTFELRERVYYTLTAQTDSALHGSVTGGGSYVIGDTATVTAIPAQHFVFDHWNDGDTTNPRKVEVLSDTTLTAYWQLVCPDTSYVFEAEACDSYLWHGVTYTTSVDTPTYTTQDILGCDSVTTLHLTMKQSSTATETVTACNSYTWYGTEYTASTTVPTHTILNAVGCDSVTTLHLTVNYSNSAVETVTACNSYVWHGGEYTTSTNTPTYTTQNVAGCDSVTTLHLTINHCSSTAITACDSYTWRGTTYNASGTYTDGTDTLVLTLNQSNAATLNVTVCDSYTWHGTTYTASTVTPTFTSQNVNGCDSVTTLHLTVHHSTTGIETVTACDNYTWHGNNYTASTVTPTYTSENAMGCDSVTTLHLTINHSSAVVDNIVACDNYTWHGVSYSVSTTTPTYVTQNTVGCDSVTTLHLTVNHSNTATEMVTACDSYLWHGVTYTASTNTPTHTTQNMAGCDSVTTLYLTINNSSSATFSATACDSYEWHGTLYTASTDTASFTSVNNVGCDSVTTLHLVVNHSSTAVDNVTVCGSYMWHGTTYIASTNTPTYVTQNAVGCDSVTTLHLTVNQNSSAVETITACDSLLWHGTTYIASTNTPTYVTQNAVGCDSVTTLHLTINYSTTATDNITACDSYTWHDVTYTASTSTPTFTDVNAAGCPLVTTLHLTLNHSNSAVETVTACNNYVWHGTEYSSSTVTPTYTSENAAGCDSVTTLHLTINVCSLTEITACDSYTWRGTTYVTSGTYTDGTDTLILTVNQSNSGIETATACDSYLWHGTVYTASTNTPTYTSQNVNGCDSVTTLHLTVGNSSTGVETVTACDSYVWHGTEYIASTYTPVYTSENAAGCDSVTTLHLTINHSTSAVETLSACDSYTWHGTVYTASTNTPTYTSVNASGCDSVTTLHLTVNYSTTATESITACDSYEWHGVEYTASTNTPTYTSTNTAGCPSVTTLHLMVNYSSAGVETVTACNSYVWHGTVYTASTNTPTFTSENVAGCDSVTTLHLTVNNCSTTEVTVCDSYSWHGTVYTASGIYTDGTDTLILTVNYSSAATEVVTACNSYEWHGTIYVVSTNNPTYTTLNAAGCDSVTTLHLTINNCSTTEVTACDSYTWNGIVYNVSGTYINGNDTLVLTVNYSNTMTEIATACDRYEWYGTVYQVSTNNPTHTLTNAAGCDSVISLHLTIKHSNSVVETVTSCDSYVWHGTEYTTSTNEPTHTLPNSVGCDSVITLHLTIKYSSYVTETDTACDIYTWHGTDYTASTSTPTFTIPNAVGCDSVTTLHLTVNHSTSDTTVVSGVDTLEWRGQVITSEGVYVDSLLTVAGCDSILVLIFHPNVAIDEATDITLVVYPNPTTGRVTIAADGVRRVEVYNVNGQRIATTNGNTELDLSSQPSGVYILRIMTEQATYLARVVKK